MSYLDTTCWSDIVIFIYRVRVSLREVVDLNDFYFIDYQTNEFNGNFREMVKDALRPSFMRAFINSGTGGRWLLSNGTCFFKMVM
jgi:hypothetical protein